MRSFQAVILLCFIKIIAGMRFQTIHRTAQIDNMNRIGKFVKIGADVKIGPNSGVGDFSNIASGVLITNGSIIGQFCNIDQNVYVVNNARVHNYVNIGRQTRIHDNCEIRDFVNIGNDAEIFENVRMNGYNSIANNVLVGAGSVLDQYSSALYASQIGSNVYIGNYAKIGGNAVIDENAIILKYASIQDGAYVLKDEVIIQTPSSASLYSDCLPLDRIHPSQIDSILNGNEESVNNLLQDLMKQQFDQLSLTCPSPNFNILQLVKSLYLMKCHGRESYETNCRQHSANVLTGRTFNGIHSSGNSMVINQNGIFVDGKRFSFHELKPTLNQEFHFGSNDNKTILNDEAKDQMIRLLAIENDIQRNVRVQGDFYCKMFEDIKTKRRAVKCDT